MQEEDPGGPVVMMSGHGTVSTAVKAMKRGAFDYLEKPLSYARTVETLKKSLDPKKRDTAGTGGGSHLESLRIEPPPTMQLLAETTIPQRTIRQSTVVYGLGLHSGRRTGMVFQPLPPDSGIHFVILPTNTLIPAHVCQVAETDYATTLSKDGDNIRTVEHLLSVLHASGITNLLIKVHGEIPILDGSAFEFCRSSRRRRASRSRIALAERWSSIGSTR